MSRVHPTAAVLLACLTAAQPLRGVDLPSEAGWKALGRLDPAAATAAFQASSRARSADRTDRLGAALAELALEPHTAARVDAARTALRQLQAENADDEPGIAAAYYLARIRQLHDRPADRAGAIGAYRALLREHPGSAVAELAAPKLAVLLLYDDVPADVWNSRAAELRALLPHLVSRAARRDTRLVLATALLRLRNDAAGAYPLISACLDENLIVRPPAIATALLEAAEAARRLGRTADARRYYGRYVREFPRESATEEIGRRLAALPPEAGP